MAGVDEMIMETAGSSKNSVNLSASHPRRQLYSECFCVLYDAPTGSVPHTTFCSLFTIFL